jgi:transposase InsO family protein
VLWVADITYVPTWSGFLYLAVVMDVFSRRIVGWSMANHMRKELVVDALNMAIYRRNPKSVVHHSDQGSQYTSIAFGKRCREAGILPSMGSVGDWYDNAMCESFNATLECELLCQTPLRNATRGFACRFRFHRRLVQPASAAFSPRLSLTNELRALNLYVSQPLLLGFRVPLNFPIVSTSCIVAAVIGAASLSPLTAAQKKFGFAAERRH